METICTRMGVIIWFSIVVLLFALSTARSSSATQSLCQSGHVCVTTWQQDTGTSIGSGFSYRTGQNLSESSITYNSITDDNFGQKCSAALDGQIYAQPLVITDVNWKKLGNQLHRRLHCHRERHGVRD